MLAKFMKLKLQKNETIGEKHEIMGKFLIYDD